MAITTTDPIYTVDESEFGYAAMDFYPVPSGQQIPLEVPRVTGLVTEVGKRIPVAGAGIFDNATACKPSYNKMIDAVNYVMAIVEENCLWLDKLNTKGMIEKGFQFVVDFRNENILVPYATTK